MVNVVLEGKSQRGISMGKKEGQREVNDETFKRPPQAPGNRRRRRATSCPREPKLKKLAAAACFFPSQSQVPADNWLVGGLTQSTTGTICDLATLRPVTSPPPPSARRAFLEGGYGLWISSITTHLPSHQTSSGPSSHWVWGVVGDSKVSALFRTWTRICVSGSTVANSRPRSSHSQEAPVSAGWCCVHVCFPQMN